MLTVRQVTLLLNELANAEAETGHWFPRQNKGQACAFLREAVHEGIRTCADKDERDALVDAWTNYAKSYTN